MIKNATEFVKLTEDRLGAGLQGKPDDPIWKARSNMAGRVIKKTKTQPSLYSWKNLELTVEWLWRKRELVESPMGVFLFVERALKDFYLIEESTIETQIQDAIAWELGRPDENWENWYEVLARSVGPYRKEALKDWKAAGRG